MASTTVDTIEGTDGPVDGHSGENYLNATKGIKSWLVTLDHKRIGILYLVSILFFFLVAGCLAIGVRLELFTPEISFLGTLEGSFSDQINLGINALRTGDVSLLNMNGDIYNKFFTLHGAIMVFLFIIPSVPASLGNFVLPLMLGAKDVAFPRLNLLSYYIYVLGSILFLGTLITGQLDTGWTFYTPYSKQSGTAVISATAGAFVLGFSSILTGLNFMVTIHKMRAPGLTWKKMPLFVWGIYATALMQVLATPVLAITLLLLLFERFFGVGIFDPALGGDPVLFQHFFWFYSHPAVYIMIVPGFAIISELVTVHSKKHIFGYTAIAYSSVGIAILGFLVWGHHMFISGQSDLSSAIFSFITFFIAVPTAIKVFGWVATLWGGAIDFNTPMLYCLSFLFLFTIGGLTGLFLGTLSVDIMLHDTYFVVAHFHYVMMGGTVVAFIGGLFHWWPKMWGKMYNEFWGRVSAILVFLGFNLTFFTQFMLGSQGMPRRYATYDFMSESLRPIYEMWHQWSTIGSLVLATGLFIAGFTLLHGILWGKPSKQDPWGGKSLEWRTATPPIEHNFAKQPVVDCGPYDFDAIDHSLASGQH